MEKAKECSGAAIPQRRTRRLKVGQMGPGRRRSREAAVQGITRQRRPRNPQPVQQLRAPLPPSARVGPPRPPGRSRRLVRPRAVRR
eukprot:3484972-Pleurochrysis_carterae.AAC.1